MPELPSSTSSQTFGGEKAERSQDPDSGVPRSASIQTPETWQGPLSLSARAAASP